jgi:hypothetical protein
MKRNLFSIVIVLMVLLLGLACSPQATSAPEASATPNPAVQGGEVEDQTSLIDALRAGGAKVELGDTVEQAFFTVAGQILKVNGKDVQVFEYESAEKMEADAAQIAPDGGSIGTSMVTWVEPPHFFKSGRVLVLYVGEDKAVIDLLKGALGEQFAGR